MHDFSYVNGRLQCEQTAVESLAKKYGTPGAMNEEWGTVFWGATYARFDQVPVPRKQVATGHNPGLLLDYARFCSDGIVAFADAQARALREAASPEKWITTNLYPPSVSTSIDNEKLVANMDFASWDNYPVWGDMDAPYPWQFVASTLATCRRVLEVGCGRGAVARELASLGFDVTALDLALHAVDHFNRNHLFLSDGFRPVQPGHV